MLVPELRGEDVAPGRQRSQAEQRLRNDGGCGRQGGLCSGGYGVLGREVAATHLRETVWPGPHTLAQLDSQST